jgi:hypothetical protein
LNWFHWQAFLAGFVGAVAAITTRAALYRRRR